MGCKKDFWILLFFFFFCYSSLLFCSSADRISTGENLTDGDVIISPGRRFALGFFTPNGSNSRYLGIWYHEIPVQTVVWVANRNQPISGNRGILTIQNDGNLVVLDGSGGLIPVWLSNNSLPTSSTISNATANLMDDGNFVLNNNTNGNSRLLWQSFSHPTDTYLPDMRAYVDPGPGESFTFTSWTSPSDPSPGNYTMGIDPRGAPQIVIWDGPNRHWRSGHWTGLVFTGVPGQMPNNYYGFRLLSDTEGRSYFSYSSNRSQLINFRVVWDGHEEQRAWAPNSTEWSLLQSQPGRECDEYNKCGSFGICETRNSPICRCMPGFEPMDLVQWTRGNWSGGCIRRRELECNNSSSSDRFQDIMDVKLPDFLDYAGSENLVDCEARCLRNCSCAAFAFVFAGAINCMMWSMELVDVQHFAEGGNTLFLRLHRSEFGSSRTATRLIAIIVPIAVGLGMLFLGVTLFLLRRRKKKQQDMLNTTNKLEEINQPPRRSGEYSTDFSGTGDVSIEAQKGTGPELTYLNFSIVAAATNHFSHENKLGQGGFGLVYKGKLPSGEEVAVKRLSRKSGQGLEEFKNEVMLIAKLQHRNLVRLLGCCIYGEEKILIYEYMANKSLDSFLFDSVKKTELDWGRRFSIIEGVARGLLYLHRDSRLRIIHRDLKPSNILLDEEMTPKISDFGMARIFGGNENEANTNRVVGTYGYMAPEYAMEGLFSVKSDVYSFGILMLEIISGRRNTSFRSAEHSNIIGYAWDLWDGDRAMELLDPSIAGSSSQNEVMKCIHIAMLCVQDSAARRPNMSTVILMLESEHLNLPPPGQPTLTSRRISAELDIWNENIDVLSSSDVTTSAILGR